MKSKTLYGKKFMLSKFWQLQCVESMEVNWLNKEIFLKINKHRSVKLNVALKNNKQREGLELASKRVSFGNEEEMKKFIRIVLKNLPKYQPTSISFQPGHSQSSNPSHGHSSNNSKSV